MMNAQYVKYKKAYENYRLKVKDKRKDYDKKRYESKKSEFILRAKMWSESNREKSNFVKYDWMKRNPEKVRFYHAMRSLRQKQSIPSWVKISEIKKLRDAAKNLTKKTGIKHELDHIYPLKSDVLCGLTVPWNLRIVTKKENAIKCNKILKSFQLSGA